MEENKEIMNEEEMVLNQDDYDGSIYEDEGEGNGLLGTAILMGGGALLGVLGAKFLPKAWNWGKSKFGKKKNDSEPIDVEAIDVENKK